MKREQLSRIGNRMAAVRYLRIFIVSVCLMTLACINVFAQNVQFTAEVDQNKIALGTSAQWTLTVTGTQDVMDIPAPSVEGLDIRFLGPSTQISIVNGRYSSRKSWIYSLVPLQTGRFTIPSVNINVNGTSYTTDPVEIEVTDTPGNPSVTSVPSSPSAAETGTNLTDKIFLVLRLSKDKVYVNERLPVKILLFMADLSVADVRFPEFSQPGMDVEKFGQPRQYEQVVNGIRYHIGEFDTNIYPTRVGEMTIGPVTLECNIVIKSAGTRPPSGGRGFEEDFFNSFFDRYEERPMTLQSKPVSLTVLPLPEENKPVDFAGAVGRFNMDVSVGPSEVNVGDPITVKINIGGEGNLKAVEAPAFTRAEKFKIYDPQIKEEGGFKKLEQVLIPESDQLTQIPEVAFSYFDPAVQQYQTISQGPFPVTVREPKSEESLKVVGAADSGVDGIDSSSVLGRDIVFIKDSPGKFYIIGQRFYRTVSFYLIVVLLGGAWAYLCGMCHRKHKIATDIVYARRLLAPKEARRGLRAAKGLLALDDPQKFYDALFRTLQKYLGHKLHLSSGAVTFETVQANIAGRVAEKWLEEIRRAFTECDALRYAPARSSAESRAESYARVQRIIDALERTRI